MKKGDKVILCMFTGLKAGIKEIVKADKKTVVILDNKGKELVFDAKTLKQISPAPKAERWANYIIADDGSYVPKKRPRKPKKQEKVSGVTLAEPVENWEDDDDDDFDEDEFVEV